MVETLNDEEYMTYVDDIAEITTKTIGELVALADKHNIDRDDTVKYFAELFTKMAALSTFQNYKIRGEK